jgi:hypothetical protein
LTAQQRFARTSASAPERAQIVDKDHSVRRASLLVAPRNQHPQDLVVFRPGVDDRDDLARGHNPMPFLDIEPPANVRKAPHVRRVANDNICNATPARRDPQRAVVFEHVRTGPDEHDAPSQEAIPSFRQPTEPAVRPVARPHRSFSPTFLRGPQA